MSEHELIRERIRRLLERTTARGCTEAEATAAAEKAAELMRRYQLTDADVAFDSVRVKNRSAGASVRDRLWSIVAYSTNTSSIFIQGYREHHVEFHGRDAYVEIAAYLKDLLDRAIDREIRTFKQSTFYRRRRSLTTKRQAVADFTDALVTRLAARVFEAFATVRDPEERLAAEKRRDLMCTDQVAVERRPITERYSEARWAGYHAGNNVPINRGVSGDDPKLIGGSK